MGLLGKKADFTIGENGIDVVEQVIIGGVKQTILLQGQDVTKPVLLLLHGGPSMPIPGVSSRGKDYTIVTNTMELVKHYIVVFWDQRGTGKSYHASIPQSTMNVNQFVADALELTDLLRERFNQDKIFLVGHSWGTVIGLSAAAKHPEKYYSYVGLSQLVSWTDNDRLGVEWAKNEAIKRNNVKALQELDAVGDPPYMESFQQWRVLRKWQQRFGTLVYSDKEIRHPGLAKITLDMMRGRGYSLKDMYNTFVRGFNLVYSIDFIREVQELHFAKSIPAVQLPVTFIHGSKDVHVFGSLTKEYFHHLQAPYGKQLIWMDKSAHAFHPEDTKKIEQLLIAELKHLA